MCDVLYYALKVRARATVKIGCARVNREQCGDVDPQIAIRGWHDIKRIRFEFVRCVWIEGTNFPQEFHQLTTSDGFAGWRGSEIDNTPSPTLATMAALAGSVLEHTSSAINIFLRGI